LSFTWKTAVLPEILCRRRFPGRARFRETAHGPFGR
jgi:hypothetical protein